MSGRAVSAVPAPRRPAAHPAARPAPSGAPRPGPDPRQTRTPRPSPPPGSRRAPPQQRGREREGPARAAAPPAGLEPGTSEGGARGRAGNPKPGRVRRPPASSGAGGAILAAVLLPGKRPRGRPRELHVARRERRRRSRDAQGPLPPAAPEALPAGGTGWRRAAPAVTASGGRRRAVLTRRTERNGAGPARPGAAAPWWPSSASVWPTRSTARTSRSAGTSPRRRERPRRRRRRSGRGCWRCSSSWSADQPSSRSSRASVWACDPPAPPRIPGPSPPFRASARAAVP